MNRQLKKREWLFALIYLFRFSLKVKIYFKRGEDNLPMLTNLTVVKFWSFCYKTLMAGRVSQMVKIYLAEEFCLK